MGLEPDPGTLGWGPGASTSLALPSLDFRGNSLLFFWGGVIANNSLGILCYRDVLLLKSRGKPKPRTASPEM